MKMKPLHNLATLLLICFSLQMTAQIEYGGTPSDWHEKDLSRFAISFVEFDALDLDVLAAEDEVTDAYKEVPYRFGHEWEVALTPDNSGNHTTADNGDHRWQLGVHCAEATSISFIFNEFKLAKTAKLYVWNADRSEFKGAFTHRNNKEWESFSIGLLHDDQVVIELVEPAAVAGQSIIEVSTIVHGYRSIVQKAEEAYDEANRGPFGNSGACNINVNCPEGDQWQVEKRGVALIVSGGFAVCSGTLVNNTAQDGTPYFLTANHCLGGENNWVFYFNHETAGCTGNTGPTNQSISGSDLRASSGGSDMALLELSETPPDSFNVQYCGWDNSDATTVTETTGIHHPSGDLKKICFDEDAPYHTNQAGAAVWYIDEWEDGVTEGGSSGSALFDQNHRIIGQLYGGFAACAGSVNNGQADWYGRFGVSWDGNSASTRLRDWLDPLNTGATTLDGFPEGFVAFEYDAGVGGIGNIDEVICGSVAYPTMTLVNFGTETLTSVNISYYANDELITSYDWTGSLAQGQSEEFALPVTNLVSGANEVEVILANPNGQADENNNNNASSVSFQAFAGPTYEFSMELLTDDFADETSWEIRNESNVVIYEGGGYSNATEYTEVFCLAEGCYTFTIFDSFGDGICCGWGDGQYQLYTHLGYNFATGGEFEESQSVEFCTQDLSVGDENIENLTLYPNPTAGMITVAIPANAESLSVVNTLGQVVMTVPVTNATDQLQVNLSSLAQGWYHLSVLTAEGVISGKVLKK